MGISYKNFGPSAQMSGMKVLPPQAIAKHYPSGIVGTLLFTGLNPVGQNCTQLSTTGGFNGGYELHDAMNDTANTGGYGPNSWPNKVVHGANGNPFVEVLDAGVDNFFVVGDVQVTTDPGNNAFSTDNFEIEVSNDNTNWTSCGTYDNTGLSGTTNVDTVPLSGQGRYLKLTITPVLDTGETSNYPRFYFNRIDNPWDISIYTSS